MAEMLASNPSWGDLAHLLPVPNLMTVMGNTISLHKNCPPNSGCKKHGPVSSTAIAVDAATAAEMLGICTRTLFAEMDRDNIRGFRIGRAWRIRVEEINNYIARQEKKQAGK